MMNKLPYNLLMIKHISLIGMRIHRLKFWVPVLSAIYKLGKLQDIVKLFYTF